MFGTYISIWKVFVMSDIYFCKPDPCFMILWVHVAWIVLSFGAKISNKCVYRWRYQVHTCSHAAGSVFFCRFWHRQILEQSIAISKVVISFQKIYFLQHGLLSNFWYLSTKNVQVILCFWGNRFYYT